MSASAARTILPANSAFTFLSRTNARPMSPSAWMLVMSVAKSMRSSNRASFPNDARPFPDSTVPPSFTTTSPPWHLQFRR